jgi:hypothetical protein
MNLIASQFLVATPANLVQVVAETLWDWFSGAEMPRSQRAGTNFIALKSENHVSGSCVQEVNVCS